jgi:hypothetical protein
MPMAWKMGLSSGMVVGSEEARRSVAEKKEMREQAQPWQKQHVTQDHNHVSQTRDHKNIYT